MNYKYSVEEKIRLIPKNDEEKSNLKEMIDIWRENYKMTWEAAEKSFTRFVFFFLLFLMINSAQLTQVGIFGLVFHDTSIPLLLSYFMCVLFYYRFFSTFYYIQILEDAIREGYFQCYNNYSKSELTELCYYPAMTQIENIFIAFNKNKKSVLSTFALRWNIILAMLIGLIPIVSLIWASYAIISNPSISRVLSIPMVSISSLIFLRAFIFIIEIFRGYKAA